MMKHAIANALNTLSSVVYGCIKHLDKMSDKLQDGGKSAVYGAFSSWGQLLLRVIWYSHDSGLSPGEFLGDKLGVERCKTTVLCARDERR